MRNDVVGCHGGTRIYNSTDFTQENTEVNWKCKILQITGQKLFALDMLQFWREYTYTEGNRKTYL